MKKKSLLIPLAVGIFLVITILIIEFRGYLLSRTPTRTTYFSENGISVTVESEEPVICTVSNCVRKVSEPAPAPTNDTATVDAAPSPRPSQEVKSEPAPDQVKTVTPKAKPIPSVAKAPVPEVPRNRQVILAHRRIAIASERKFPTKFCTAQTPTVRKTAPYVLISEQPVDRSVQSQAMSNGARVAGFLPNNALLVEADAEALKRLSEDPAFVAAVEYEPMDKLQPKLLEGKDETLSVSVLLMNAAYRDTVLAFIESNGGKAIEVAAPKGKSAKTLSFTLPRTLIPKLAAKGEVRWIERLP